MKNSIRILLTFICLCSTHINAQNATFRNITSDHSWNTIRNWTPRVLPTGTATIRFDVNLNGNQYIQKIESAGSNRNSITVTGGPTDVLTLGLDGEVVINNVIDNEFRFDCNITITANSTFGNIDDDNSKLIFLANSTIDLGSKQLKIQNEMPTNPVEFHGFLSGTKELYVTGKSAAYGGIKFSSTADNTNFTGKFRTDSKPIISDIVSPQLFLPATGLLQFKNVGGTVTLNGANTMEGEIRRGTWNSGSGGGTVVFNANQDNMAKLRIASNETNESLTLEIAASVDQLWFITSQFEPGNSLNIVGFEDGVLGFGNPVTQTVLDTWKLEGVEPANGTLVQDANGYIRRRTIWTGATDNDWSEATNWKNDLAPALIATKKVEIPSGLTNYPIITSSQTLMINASLTIDSGAKITVYGAITNLGTITNNGDLILQSDASGAGYLFGASVANVTQQRYLSSNQRGWRLLSNPSSSSPSFGNFAANSTTPFTIGDDSASAFISANNWTEEGDSGIMESKTAYGIFIRGVVGEGIGGNYPDGDPSNVTVSIKGTASNIEPDEITTTAGDFYLVANPYTARVSVSRILGESSGLSNTVDYWNPTKQSSNVQVNAGGYDAETVIGFAGGFDDVVLPPMGAIFVYATTDGIIKVPTDVIFTDENLGGDYDHKSTKERKNTDDDAIKLTIEVKSNGIDYDKLALQFKEEGTVGANIDLGKLQNTIFDIYSITEDNTYMAVSELALKEQTIPLGIYSDAMQNFTIHIAENSIPIEFEALLKDALLNTTTPLPVGTDYSFDVSNYDEDQGDERFSIIFKSTGALSVEEDVLSANIQVYPNPSREQFNVVNKGTNGETSFEIYTVTGQLVHAIKAQPNTTTTVHVNDWAAGIYILKAMNNETSTTKKIIVQ